MLSNLAAAATASPPDYARRVLANVVSEEENVKSVVGKVQLGEADAGIVYRSDVTPRVARYVRVFDDPRLRERASRRYPIAAGQGRAAARQRARRSSSWCCPPRASASLGASRPDPGAEAP